MDGRSLGKVCVLQKVALGHPSKSQSIGTYTFPISFEIPSHMPASIKCDGGSITCKLVAKVRRPGVFTPNLTATRYGHVVSLPADADADMPGEIQHERPWTARSH